MPGATKTKRKHRKQPKIRISNKNQQNINIILSEIRRHKKRRRQRGRGAQNGVTTTGYTNVIRFVNQHQPQNLLAPPTNDVLVGNQVASRMVDTTPITDPNRMRTERLRRLEPIPEPAKERASPHHEESKIQSPPPIRQLESFATPPRSATVRAEEKESPDVSQGIGMTRVEAEIYNFLRANRKIKGLLGLESKSSKKELIEACNKELRYAYTQYDSTGAILKRLKRDEASGKIK